MIITGFLVGKDDMNDYVNCDDMDDDDDDDDNIYANMQVDDQC